MQIERDASKETSNRNKHGFGFALAEIVFSNPLTTIVYDRFENGEHRWHAIGHVGNHVIVVVHTYPDPENEERVRVIGLRKATKAERARYENQRFD